MFIFDSCMSCMLNSSCIPGMNPTWSWWMIFLMCCWIWFASVLQNIFAFVFIKDSGLQLSVFVLSLSGFDIKIRLVRLVSFGGILSPFFFNNLRKFGINYSLKVLVEYSSEAIASLENVFFFYYYWFNLITWYLWRYSVSSWFNVGKAYVSKRVSISAALSLLP